LDVIALRKKGLPKPLLHLQQILNKRLSRTGVAWETLKRVYGWVQQLASSLGESEDLCVEERQLRFVLILQHMQEQSQQFEPVWQRAIAHFLKVTQSYGSHLFFCYQILDLSRTNNDLEQAFGQVHFHERLGEKEPHPPALVVRGAVRVQAALAT
jgi:hypothetical protein